MDTEKSNVENDKTPLPETLLEAKEDTEEAAGEKGDDEEVANQEDKEEEELYLDSPPETLLEAKEDTEEAAGEKGDDEEVVNQEDKEEEELYLDSPPETLLEAKEDTEEAAGEKGDDEEVAKQDQTFPTGIPPSAIKEGGVYKIPHPNAKLGLTRITKEGVYEYKVPASPRNYLASVRLGVFSPSNLENPKTGSRFIDLYDESPVILFDYEWKLPYLLKVKVGSGLLIAQGNGTFANSDSKLTPKEVFTFIVFPSSLGLVYKVQYWENQLFVPYVDGGVDLFTFVESRDDGRGTKLGATIAGHLAVGGSLSLGFLDSLLFVKLDREYGINSLWLTAEVRSIFSLSGNLNFSGSFVNIGVTTEF